ncbi:hypothetical protein LNO92_00425 [Klebsiella variicola subsp. variicola]|nr:hypothetical protein [Klebsiella variicola subsp. variicola]
MFDAWETDDLDVVLKLIRKAIKNPRSVLTHTHSTARYPKSPLSQKSVLWRRLYMRPVSHWVKIFRNLRAISGGFVETRPYMRAKAALADALWESGNFYPAMSHCHEMLKLNPNDNQGFVIY